MPYTKSLARKDYQAGTKTLLCICAALRQRGDDHWQAAQEVLHQAAIFKTCALLETYILAVVRDWFDVAGGCGQTIASLPPETKCYLLLNDHAATYKQYAYDNSEWQAIISLKRKQENRLFEDSTPLAEVLNHALILKDRKYPSVTNLDALFKRLGVANLFDRIDAKIRRPSKLVLASFLGIRQDIAHQTAPDLQYSTVREQIENIGVIVGAIDRILYSHIVRCGGPGCWRTASIFPID